MKTWLAYAGLLILVFLAILGKSAVMGVSVLAMGAAYWWMRAAPLKKKLAFVAAAALVGSLLAEVVHTLYHMLDLAPAGANDSGGFFVSATLVGLINAVAFGALLLLLEWLVEPARS